MKKKIVTVLLALSIFTLAAGCGEKKDTNAKEDTKTEQTAEEEFVLTNKEGKVVAADVENLEDYVTLGEYKNLEVSEAPKEEITEDQVNTYIDSLLLYRYDQTEVTEDRAVQENDTVNIDYTGYMDGEEFDGGSATGADLVIGSGGFIEGFEDGLIGHKKGEEVTLDLTFPDDYKAKDLQGKAVQFKVKINKISEPPKLTDEWVAANTDYKTVEEFKAAQKADIEKSRDVDYETQVKSDLFSLLVENTEFKDYPEEILKSAKEKVREQLDSLYQAQQGITFDDFVEQQGLTEEEVDEQLTELAKSYSKQNLVVQAIFNAEGIELTEEDYQEAEEEYAKDSGFKDAETMESYYSDKETIKNSVLWNHACNILMETAVITEKEADAQEQS